MEKVYLYARTASKRQGKSPSLQSQVEMLREFAKKEGYEITKVFEDYGYSRVSQRPAFEQMLKEVAKGKIRYVLCMSLDRMIDDILTLGKILMLMGGKGFQIITLRNTYDKSYEKQILMNMELGMIQSVRKAVSDRIKRGLRRKNLASMKKTAI